MSCQLRLLGSVYRVHSQPGSMGQYLKEKISRCTRLLIIIIASRYDMVTICFGLYLLPMAM